MTSYVVTEGPADALLIKRVLEEAAIHDVSVVPAGGSPAVASFAKSLMLRRPKALAVVVDADTTDEWRVRARERELYDLIKPAAGERPFRVFLAVPEVESVFFAKEVEPLWGELFGDDAWDVQSARLAPKAALSSKTGYPNLQNFIANLSPRVIKALTRTSLFQNLRSFLSKPSRWRPTDSSS